MVQDDVELEDRLFINEVFLDEKINPMREDGIYPRHMTQRLSKSIRFVKPLATGFSAKRAL
ncbi:MAG TPA: hypothetical protein VFV38_43455 [Ktedonobacteraceae bacterium]|nr:hypothetical protein [Ktedonobacteraceae bacterium]